MDRQTVNVAFATQKGGSGKTAITVLVAGYLHYRLGCPLAVIDCDFPQCEASKEVSFLQQKIGFRVISDNVFLNACGAWCRRGKLHK